MTGVCGLCLLRLVLPSSLSCLLLGVHVVRCIREFHFDQRDPLIIFYTGAAAETRHQQGRHRRIHNTQSPGDCNLLSKVSFIRTPSVSAMKLNPQIPQRDRRRPLLLQQPRIQPRPLPVLYRVLLQRGQCQQSLSGRLVATSCRRLGSYLKYDGERSKVHMRTGGNICLEKNASGIFFDINLAKAAVTEINALQSPTAPSSSDSPSTLLQPRTTPRKRRFESTSRWSRQKVHTVQSSITPRAEMRTLGKSPGSLVKRWIPVAMTKMNLMLTCLIPFIHQRFRPTSLKPG